MYRETSIVYELGEIFSDIPGTIPDHFMPFIASRYH